MTKKVGKKINACELWIWRKMQRISRTEKETNESVRLEIWVEEEEMLQLTAIRRKLGFFGHVMRSGGLEKGMMLACGEGRRRRRQPRRRCMDEIHSAVKNCQKIHPCNRSRQHRLTVYTQAYSHVEQGRSCHLCQTQFKGPGHYLCEWSHSICTL